MLVASLAVLAAGVAPASASPPGSGYAWAQPGASWSEVSGGQPACVPAGSVSVVDPAALSAYRWAQPGTSWASVSGGQPSCVPVVPAAAAPVALSGYRWVQPGIAPVTTENAQPPDWVPTG